MPLSAKRPERQRQLLDNIAKDDEKLHRLNVQIEESLYQKMRLKAVTEHQTLSQITRSLWIEYLSK